MLVRDYSENRNAHKFGMASTVWMNTIHKKKWYWHKAVVSEEQAARAKDETEQSE